MPDILHNHRLIQDLPILILLFLYHHRLENVKITQKPPKKFGGGSLKYPCHLVQSFPLTVSL